MKQALTPDEIWTRPLDAMLAELDATVSGLTGDEAARRRGRYGLNQHR